MSIFLEMSKVVEEEHIAGRITIAEAKAQLSINASIAIGLEYMRIEKAFKYTSADRKRDKQQIRQAVNANFYCR